MTDWHIFSHSSLIVVLFDLIVNVCFVNFSTMNVLTIVLWCNFSVPIHAPLVDLHKSCSLCGGCFVSHNRLCRSSIYLYICSYIHLICRCVNAITTYLYANLMIQNILFFIFYSVDQVEQVHFITAKKKVR